VGSPLRSVEESIPSAEKVTYLRDTVAEKSWRERPSMSAGLRCVRRQQWTRKGTASEMKSGEAGKHGGSLYHM
jgi:hypothetical protein